MNSATVTATRPVVAGAGWPGALRRGSTRPGAPGGFTWVLPEPVPKKRPVPNQNWVLADRIPPGRVWFTARQTMVGAAVLFVCFAHLFNITNWPVFFDDEGTYVAQAWSVYTRGQLAHYPTGTTIRPAAGCSWQRSSRRCRHSAYTPRQCWAATSWCFTPAPPHC